MSDSDIRLRRDMLALVAGGFAAEHFGVGERRLAGDDQARRDPAARISKVPQSCVKKLRRFASSPSSPIRGFRMLIGMPLPAARAGAIRQRPRQEAAQDNGDGEHYSVGDLASISA